MVCDGLRGKVLRSESPRRNRQAKRARRAKRKTERRRKFSAKRDEESAEKKALQEEVGLSECEQTRAPRPSFKLNMWTIEEGSVTAQPTDSPCTRASQNESEEKSVGLASFEMMACAVWERVYEMNDLVAAAAAHLSVHNKRDPLQKSGPARDSSQTGSVGVGTAL